MLIFRQLCDPQSSTYTYLLGDRIGGEAVLIDPVFEQVRRDAALIEELKLTLVATLETHVHADERSQCTDRAINEDTLAKRRRALTWFLILGLLTVTAYRS